MPALHGGRAGCPDWAPERSLAIAPSASSECSQQVVIDWRHALARQHAQDGDGLFDLPCKRAARLAVERPEMKVLFMSGYTDDAVLQHGVLDSGVAYLQKPLTPTSLTRKVREVLGGNGK